MLSGHSAMKLEINDKRNCKNPTNTWKLNNTLLSNQWVTEKIKEINIYKRMKIQI